MDSPCIKQTVCKVLKIFQYGKYLVAYALEGVLIGLELREFDRMWDMRLVFPHCQKIVLVKIRVNTRF